MGFSIARVHARQVLDSRGNPTVAVEVELVGGSAPGSAMVPSGASTGSHEAVELRDGGSEWSGKGVSGAVSNVNGEIAAALDGRDFDSQEELDRTLCELDGTTNKGRLGANGILGVSLAAARAVAGSRKLALWEYIAEISGGMGPRLPVPMLNVVNGGEHANNSIDVQEFMLVPHGFSRFDDALEAAVRTYHVLRGRLDAAGLPTAVGDEGGFAPDLGATEDALEALVDAIGAAGFIPGQQIAIALDVAATELWDEGRYRFAGEGIERGVEEMVAWYARLVERFPIVSIEDGMAEDDWDGWHALTTELGARTQLVGDDLFVTNVERLRRGVESGVGNSILIKPNQIGTLSETLATMALADASGMTSVVSHRSGETEDSTIADIAVGTGCGQIKTGAPARSDRVAKYNRLLEIAETVGSDRYESPFSARVPQGSV